MDIYKIKEEMIKISLELSKKLPKHLQDDKKYIKNMFLKEKQKTKKLLKAINKLNQKDTTVIETKKELTNMYNFITRFIKIMIGGTRKKNKNKRNRTLNKRF
jgi:hypothetical protein